MKLRHLDRLSKCARTSTAPGVPDVLNERPTTRLSGHNQDDVAALPRITFP